MSYKKIVHQGYTEYQNENGADIGIAEKNIIEQDGFIFRDLAGNGKLLPYEDWRLDDETRAIDLASRLSIEEIAGLMMYSPHQMVPSRPGTPFSAVYNGKPFDEKSMQKWDLTDAQKKFLSKDHVRHVLAMILESAEVAAKWNNSMQAFTEKLPYGIPVNFSTDPRHKASSVKAEFHSSAQDVSRWPEGLVMAALFSAKKCQEYAQIIAKEYRAMGLTTALSPQVDIATDPRWMRLEDTWGVCPQLVTDYAKAYCDGMQTTEGSATGWGKDSVCTMAKHWPGGGTGEGGRDAHYAFGKYAVYPGNNGEIHLKPFTEGAFRLKGKTGCTSAVMPYYTISWNRDIRNFKNTGNSYSEYLIKDLLRTEYHYTGIVCTDWGITADPEPSVDSFGSRCYGVEKLTVAERHLLAIENGVDQFGGNSDMEPVIQAYHLGCSKYGEPFMRSRMEQSAVRLLKNIFRCGLFENPYLDPETSISTVGCSTFRNAGYKAQLESVVLLKNTGCLPVTGKKKVYIPVRHIKARKTFFRTSGEACVIDPVPENILSPYYERVQTPEQADFALVFAESPLCDPYSQEDVQNGGNGYLPITLQYRPYKAVCARRPSIAGGDFREKFTDRSYKDKTNTAVNESDLDNVVETKKRMGNKPVAVCITMHNPAVLAELEPYADAILAEFGVQTEAVLDTVSGKSEPSGLLPVQLPASMETVEKHCEDVPFDMEAYTDTCGNTYDFGFGMNWSGVIKDERTKKYHK